MASAEQERVRLRLEAFDLEVFQDGRCTTRVVLAWTEGALFDGEAGGTETLQGRLRAAALACLKAAEKATDDGLRLNLRGVKAVRAFDAWVVIVSVLGESGQSQYRLLGAATSPDDQHVAQSAVQAVLDATNRVLEKYL